MSSAKLIGEELVGQDVDEIVGYKTPTISQAFEEAKKEIKNADTMTEEARLIRDAAKGTGRVLDPYAKIPGVDKVAIVGFANTTRHLAPYGDPEWEIWSLNEGYHFGFLWRWDRWFQIHPRWNFARRFNANHEDHLAWLKAQPACGEPDGFPIYMHQHYDDIPASTPYPLQEIIDKFPYCNSWLSSSIAEMLAMALYLEIKTISFWGVEMGSETEYRYQRENFSYWKGVADGLGFKVTLPDVTNICRGPVYGFQAIPNLHIDNIKPLFEVAEKREAEAGRKFTRNLGAMDELVRLKKMGIAIPDEEFNRILQGSRQLKRVANSGIGVKSEFKSYINHIVEQYPTNVDPEAVPSVGRQELEFRQKALRIGREDRLKGLGSATGKMTLMIDALEEKEKLPTNRQEIFLAIDKYRKEAEKIESVLQAMDGSVVANNVLINLTDMHYQRGVRIARLEQLLDKEEKEMLYGTESEKGQNPPTGGTPEKLPEQPSQT